MLGFWQVSNGIEGRDGVECFRIEVHRGHIGQHEFCIRDVASSALDLPARCVDTCDPKALLNKVANHRNPSATPQIKDRTGRRQMRDQLRELCSSHRRPPEPINVIVGDLVVPKGHEPLLVLIGHRVIYQSATTCRQCLCTLARRQHVSIWEKPTS